MSDPNKPLLQLTDDQEKKLIELWNQTPNNPPDIKTLTTAIFGANCDGRSQEGKAIKSALAKYKLKAKTTKSPVNDVKLTDDQKAFISNNFKTMSVLEMSKLLFNNPMLIALDSETRIVSNYVKTLQTNMAFAPGDVRDMPEAPYAPPTNLEEVVMCVNKYLNVSWNKDKLQPAQTKNLIALIGFLHTYRFIAQMNNYQSMTDRSLCEDAFIRATWDKPDLAQEEIDQYIEYANQVVVGFNVQRRSNQLQAQLEENANNAANDDSIKISMSLVEAMGKASVEYHQCLTRQQKLLDDLKEKRSARISKQVKENASIINLIQMWKEEETRKELLAHAEKEQDKIKDEVKRLSSLDELKCRILGLTKEEVING